MEENQKKKGFFHWILPKKYDFFGALKKHASLVEEGMDNLVLWLSTKDHSYALRVREIEHEADDVMLEVASRLGEIYLTPIDPEDISLLSNSIDRIINSAKNTVREMEILGVAPNEDMLKIAEEIRDGVKAFHQAINTIPDTSPECLDLIERARKSERNTEKIFRVALDRLFGEDDLKEVLKKREVHRHLNFTSENLLEAANLLKLMNVKYG